MFRTSGESDIDEIIRDVCMRQIENKRGFYGGKTSLKTPVAAKPDEQDPDTDAGQGKEEDAADTEAEVQAYKKFIFKFFKCEIRGVETATNFQIID